MEKKSSICSSLIFTAQCRMWCFLSSEGGELIPWCPEVVLYIDYTACIRTTDGALHPEIRHGVRGQTKSGFPCYIHNSFYR